ncbi:MFS transporter [Micromonospora peucetia]|uniref:MFS transporter n=1 Tax=Micromonospora peucetia TaxID=47871 RepID=A0A1C6W120_9ACTN|nr:MFS transporter [Micromonospora peucetia]WSA31849.1 MFS transporter [Micromonospora peucetia]SCL72226.1 Major Facilitator Superfamily protein [Micromonospora peucetia]
MTVHSPRVSDARARRLAATLYGYAFLTELVLLYPLYALLFSDTGLSVWQISSLFVIWSAASILLEVPSGAFADAVSRRLLLSLAPVVTAAGFALWVLVPSYPAFAVGFVLWGAGGALASGALEALVFTELDRLGAAGRYARVIGRAKTAGTLGVLTSILLAGPVYAAGGYLAVGVASVFACLLAAALATRLPEHRRPAPADVATATRLPEYHRTAPAPADAVPACVDAVPACADAVLACAAPAPAPAGPACAAGVVDGGPERTGRDVGADDDEDLGWWASLRAGFAEIHADRAVRAAVLLVAVVAAVWGALDEYTPLLARDTGVGEATVPLLLLLTWVGVGVGGLLAPMGERLTVRGYAGLLALSALALAAGALLVRPVGFVLVGAAFCGFQLATVLADARLQARITGGSRATVTSLAGMATDVTIIGVYGGYGLLATGAGNGVAFAVAAVPYLIVALLLVITCTGPARPRRR